MSDLIPSSGGGFWVAWRRGSMSVRVSSLISNPSWVTLSEWVRKLAVHFWIHSSVLASFPSLKGGADCHVHLRPHGQLILTSVNGLLVLYFPVIFFIPLIPFFLSLWYRVWKFRSPCQYPFCRPVYFVSGFLFPLGFPLCLFPLWEELSICCVV